MNPGSRSDRESTTPKIASRLDMFDLIITPQGHLHVRESEVEAPDRKPSKALLAAYSESSARGMLHSASEEMEAPLPPSFEFARSIARVYLTNLCKAATGEPGEPIPELPPPSADLDRAILQAPPMTGLEYLTLDVLSNWWRDLDTLTRGEIARHREGLEATSASATRSGDSSAG